MPQVVQWPAGPGTTSETRSPVVETCRHHLSLGDLVIIPSEAGYVAVANGLHAEAVARLAALRRNTDSPLPAIAVRGEADARDWVPDLGPIGRRLARRGWPGPLTLVFMNGVKDAAATRLPDGVLRTICPGWELGLAAPQHAAVQLLLQAVSFPLVLGELLTDAGEPITAANNAAVSEAAVLVDDTSTPDSKEATVVEVHRDKWVIRREGAIPTAEVGRLAAMSVLFVCTGNTCRSPLAAALCRKQLADRLGCTADELPARGYVVASAGLAAMRDEPAAAEAVAVAGELGADLTGHASRPATPDVLDKADLIVGMTAGHLGGLDGIVGRDVRTRLLCGESDLADPIGGDLLVYQTCAGTIWQHLPGLVEELAGGER